VRDGGSWGEQMELNLDVAGYSTIISLPLGTGTKAAEEALVHAGEPRHAAEAGRRTARGSDSRPWSCPSPSPIPAKLAKFQDFT
jgi:hypothetical protein